MRHLTIALISGALLLAVPPPADAQDFGGRYTVSVVGGRIYYDNASALQNTWSGGLEMEYNVKEWAGLGLYLFGARPTTDGSFFPLVRLQFQDTVLFQLVSQQVTQIDFGLSAKFRYSLGQIQLRAMGGVGRYVFYLDDDRIDSPGVPGALEDSFAEWEFVVGAGVGYHFGRTGAVEFQVGDFIYTGYDRERFNASAPLLAAPNVPHPRADIPAPKSTLHNIRLQLAFSFILGGGQ